MKGFPLLSACVVAVLFALGWWPLRWVMTEAGSAVAPAATVAAPPVAAGRAALRIHGATAIARLQVEHLGREVLSVPGGSRGDVRHEFESIELPREGVEFWVDAELEPAITEGGRSALAIELTPEGGEARTVTLWSDETGAVADVAFFIWEGAGS